MSPCVEKRVGVARAGDSPEAEPQALKADMDGTHLEKPNVKAVLIPHSDVLPDDA
jgi:hypothetical protein